MNFFSLHVWDLGCRVRKTVINNSVNIHAVKIMRQNGNFISKYTYNLSSHESDRSCSWGKICQKKTRRCSRHGKMRANSPLSSQTPLCHPKLHEIIRSRCTSTGCYTAINSANIMANYYLVQISHQDHLKMSY